MYSVHCTLYNIKCSLYNEYRDCVQISYITNIIEKVALYIVTFVYSDIYNMSYNYAITLPCLT